MEWNNCNKDKWEVRGVDVINPIELGKAIAEYGISIVTGRFLVLVYWLIKEVNLNDLCNCSNCNINNYSGDLL